jgi:O-antigen/teichoic acid export membrane protein
MTASEAPPEAPRRSNPSAQAGALVFGTTLATLSSALLPLLLVRLLGKADIAELMALVLVYETVALVTTLGFPQTLMYHLPSLALAERKAMAKRIGFIMVGLGALAAAVTASIGLWGENLPGALASEAGSRISLRPLLLLAPSLLAELPSRVVPNLLVAEHRAKEASALGVVRTIITTAATLIPVALGYDIWVVAAWYSACRAGLGLTLPWAIRRAYGASPTGPCGVSPKQLFRFALPLGATDIVSLLNQQFDRWLILLSFPAAAFADYQAGAWQVPVVSTIAYSVGAAYMPSMVEAFRRAAPREAIATWRATIIKVSLIVLPITMGFVVGAKELMGLLFTKAYVGAAPVFQLYSLLTLGRVAAFGSVIVAAGQPRYVLQAAFLSFAANVVLAIPLTTQLGFIGPALATVLAFIPTVVFYVWAIARASGLRIGEVFPLLAYLRILGLSAVAGALAWLVKSQLVASAGFALGASVGVTIVAFGILGSLTGTVGRGDWRYLTDWLKLRFAR